MRTSCHNVARRGIPVWLMDRSGVISFGAKAARPANQVRTQVGKGTRVYQFTKVLRQAKHRALLVSKYTFQTLSRP
jgi:hypothetical protein